MFTIAQEVKGEFEKSRAFSILRFQDRIYDLAEAQTDHIGNRLNFIKIIYKNLTEFITTRLQELPLDQMLLAINVIEELFEKIGKLMQEINSTYKISQIDDGFYQQRILLSKDYRYVYTGENDIQSYLEVSEMYGIKEVSGTEIILYHGNMKPSDSGFISIKAPKEIVLFEKYFELYRSLNLLTCDTSRCCVNEEVNIGNIDNNCDLLFFRNPYKSYTAGVVYFIYSMCTSLYISSIFITLYRTAENSMIIKYLIKAAKSGKKVFVYMETTARDDEQKNMDTIIELRNNGVHCKFNYFDFKVHSKIFLAINKDGTKYAHIGTGNYNENTAKLYTDCNLITTDKEITNQLLLLFVSIFEKKMLSPDSLINDGRLYMSPWNLREKIDTLIDEEISKGEKGVIKIKCNNLFDKDITEKLKIAAKAGVDIKIICRTGCSIMPDTNLEIRSKVGKYLEHDRFYIFGDKAYISSADLLVRNLSKRVEILCKVQYDKVFEIFDEVWNSDHIHVLHKNGAWIMTEN